jgi:hypothetical protein
MGTVAGEGVISDYACVGVGGRGMDVEYLGISTAPPSGVEGLRHG